MGDSISTYEGVSDDVNSNSTLAGGAIYYTPGKWDVYQNDTWWQQTADAFGMEILVNNSWSGSSVLHTRRGTEGAYVDRCVQLHNDHTGEEPDIIVVYMGGNDFNYYQDTLGNADIDYNDLITENEDGTFDYAEPVTTCEAYAIMLHKMKIRYPEAEIYCMTSTPRRSPDKEDDYPDLGQPTTFNEERKKIVTYFGCTVVDIENCGISKEAEEFDKYIGDGRSHPNAEGMDLISQALCSAILEKETTLYDVSGKYNAVNTDNNAAVTILGNSYLANLTVQNGYDGMNVTVTMGGQDVTEEAYSNGKVYIETVTGDIIINATAERNPLSFSWELIDNELVSTGNAENNLTKLAGSVTEGILDGVRYQLENSVRLKYDYCWVLEWKCSEDWRGVLLSSNPPQLAPGRCYLSRTKGGQLCFGSWDGKQYDNYGVGLSNLDNQVHTYRLENRIATDGSNMVWLYMDGTEMGPMNNYFVGSKSQNVTSDWISGRDFEFSFIGSDSTLLNNCAMKYLEVIECNHVYENGICAHCSAEHPNLANFNGKVISILGDSISTFAGYIPTADGFNLEHLARYPQDNLVTDVNETWWLQVINELDAKLGINDSWRGSTVSGNTSVTSGVSGSLAAMCNLTRIQNLGSNGTPDVILFYGGTNDLAHVSKVGTFDSATAPTMVDLTTKSWDNLADGYVNTLLRLQHYYPEAKIVAMLPTHTATYYSDTKLAQANEVLADICEHYGVKYVDLRDSGVTAEYLPDGIHPGEEGMDMITESVIDLLVTECKIEAGENVVHSVTHNLTNVKTSLAHLKGVSNGESFVETITSDEEIVVSIKMDGVDITEQCYSNGTITIGNVTGALEITAKAIFSLAGRLQQLPDEYHGVNLWSILRHDDDYYSANGWQVHSSGKVKSVTIPVVPEERIYASSFEAAGTNGSSTSGIRITFFDENGVLISMTANEVYAEFKENGFITIPDNAVAVSIPMWTDSNEWKLFITDDSAIPGSLLTEHLQKLPENVCSGVNLWNTLKPESVYYNGTKWGSVANVYSVTFPVSSGEKISSTSFKGIGENGSNAQDGIRVTYFDEKGVLKSLTPAQTYSEFSTNGYLTVPEGAVAMNIPMWTNSDDNELYILNLEHSYENGICCGCDVAQPAPIITKQPTDGEAPLGEKISVSVQAEGEGLKYQWYIRNAGSSKFYKSSIKKATYEVVMTEARANRELYCVITDSAGNSVTSNKVTLIRTPYKELKIVSQPTDTNAAIGEKLSVSVQTEGEGLRYQWYIRNAGSSKFSKSSIKKATYEVEMTKARAGRELYCVITDALGNEVTTETVKLNRIPKEELKVVAQPESAKSALGEKVSVSVKATGEDLKYQWYIRNAGSNKFYKSSIKKSVYEVEMTGARANRELYCVITDAFGNQVTTEKVMLIRVPYKELNIISQPKDASASMGEKLSISVEAEGEGLRYQWYIRNAGSNKFYKSSIKKATYEVEMTKARANREIYCVITDALGNKVTTEKAMLILK